METAAANDIAVLYRIATLATSASDANAAKNAIVAELMGVFPAASGSLSILNPHTGYLEISAHQGLPPDTGDFALKLGQGVTGWVALHGRALIVGDVTQDARYIAARADVRCEMAAPLLHQGRVVGVVNLDADQVHAFTQDDLRRLARFGEEAGRTLHHLWQLERLHGESAQLETLIELGNSLLARLEERDLLATVTRSGRSLLDARLCTLHLCDATKNSLQLRAWSGEPTVEEASLRQQPFALSCSLAGASLQLGRVVEFQELANGGAHGAVDLPADPVLCSALVAPLVVDGESAGALAIYTARPHRFSLVQKRVLAALASFASVALSNARLYARAFQSEEGLRKTQTLTTLGLLAAEIAHEIRNPLTVIKLLQGSMGLDFPEEDPRQRDLEVITEKIEQLEAIVSRVLSFARTPGTMHARWSLAAIIEDTMHLLRAKFAQSGTQLRYQSGGKNVMLEVNKGQLQQVLLNLALNALQAMPEGGALSVGVILTNEGGGPSRVHIDFADTGHGIPVEIQPRIFESFLSGREGGTGLGLAIAQRIVRDHQGELTLLSTGREGTVMRVTLPVVSG